MSDKTRLREASKQLAIASVHRREKANRQIAAWKRYAKRELCGKSAPLRNGEWCVCVRPKGHEFSCETGDDPPCSFDPEEP